MNNWLVHVFKEILTISKLNQQSVLKDRIAAVNDELNIPVAAQHRTKKWKMHRRWLSSDGQSHSPSPQSLPSLSLCTTTVISAKPS